MSYTNQVEFEDEAKVNLKEITEQAEKDCQLVVRVSLPSGKAGLLVRFFRSHFEAMGETGIIFPRAACRETKVEIRGGEFTVPPADKCSPNYLDGEGWYFFPIEKEYEVLEAYDRLGKYIEEKRRKEVKEEPVKSTIPAVSITEEKCAAGGIFSLLEKNKGEKEIVWMEVAGIRLLCVRDVEEKVDISQFPFVFNATRISFEGGIPVFPSGKVDPREVYWTFVRPADTEAALKLLYPAKVVEESILPEARLGMEDKVKQVTVTDCFYGSPFRSYIMNSNDHLIRLHRDGKSRLFLKVSEKRGGPGYEKAKPAGVNYYNANYIDHNLSFEGGPYNENGLFWYAVENEDEEAALKQYATAMGWDNDGKVAVNVLGIRNKDGDVVNVPWTFTCKPEDVDIARIQVEAEEEGLSAWKVSIDGDEECLFVRTDQKDYGALTELGLRNSFTCLQPNLPSMGAWDRCFISVVEGGKFDTGSAYSSPVFSPLVSFFPKEDIEKVIVNFDKVKAHLRRVTVKVEGLRATR